MKCIKTDFRMYSPLIGPAEEICWTCGLAKEKHGVANTSFIEETKKQVDDIEDDLVNVVYDCKFTVGQRAWCQ